MNTAPSNAHAAHAPQAPEPAWYTQGLPHIWLPYSQMQTAPQPLPCIATQGSRITLADGRTLVDGREIYTASDLRVGLFTSTEGF